MQRLKLNDFKLKNLKDEEGKHAQKLLGQVLGDCHDGPRCIPVGNPLYGLDIPAGNEEA